MSYKTGKVEVLAGDDRHIHLVHNRAKAEALRGEFKVCRRDDEAWWLDDVLPADGHDTPTFARSYRYAVDEGSDPERSGAVRAMLSYRRGGG